MENNKEKENFCRFASLLLDVASRTLCQRFRSCFPNSTMEQTLNSHKHEIYHLWQTGNCCKCSPITNHPGRACKKRVIHEGQWNSLFDRCQSSSGLNCSKVCCCHFQAKTNVDLDMLDVTLTSCLLLNISSLNACEKQLVTDIRDLRNTVFGHSSNASLSDTEFQDCWKKLSQHLNNLAKTCSANFHIEVQEEIERIKSKVLDPSFINNTIKLAQAMKMDPTILSDLSDLKTEVEELRHEISDIKSGRPDVRRLIDETAIRLQRHKSEYFSQTRQEQAALHHIYRGQRRENNINPLKSRKAFVISGKSGSGKTSFGEEILLKLSNPSANGNERYIPIIVTDPSEWKLAVREREQVAILVDDPFGKTNFDLSKLEQWDQCFKMVNDHSNDQNNLCIIMCVRDHILKECKSELEKYDIFHDDNVVDLSSNDFKLNQWEKKHILKEYCKLYRIGRSKDCEDQKLVDTTSSTVGDASLIIDESTIDDIAESEPYIGFHQTCYLFFKNKSFFKLGLDFFTHATEKIKNEIDKLKTDDLPLPYCILVYVLLVGGRVNTNAMNEELLKNLFSLFGIPNKSPQMIDSFIRHKIEAIYLSGTDNHYKFKHQTILEAVLLSFGKSYPQEFLQLASDTVICEFARSCAYKGNPGEIFLTLPSGNHSLLAERLAAIYGIEQIANHNTTTDTLFIDTLLDASEKSIVLKENAEKLPDYSPRIFFGETCYQIHILEYMEAEERYKRFSKLVSKKACDKAVNMAIENDRINLVQKMVRRYMKPHSNSTVLTKGTDRSDKGSESENWNLGITTYINALNYLLSKGAIKSAEEIQKTCGINTDVAFDIMTELMTFHCHVNDVLPYAAYLEWKEILLSLSESKFSTMITAARDKVFVPFIKYCCRNNWVAVIKKLVNIKGDDSLFRYPEFCPVLYAARHHAKSTVKYLMKHSMFDVTVIDSDDLNLIEWCCKNDWVDILQDLVKINPEVLNQPNSSYSQLINRAARESCNLTFQYLLEIDVDLTVPDSHDKYLIQYLCHNDTIDAFQTVIDINPAVVSQPMCSYSNLILVAARGGSKDTVLSMLHKDIDPTIPDGNGMYLIQYCCRNDWTDVLEKVVELYPAVLDQPGCCYSDLIFYAAKELRKTIVLDLLDKDIDITEPNNKGKYLIQYCCENGWVDVLQSLVEINSEVLNQPGCTYSNLIVLAARKRKKVIFKHLLGKTSDFTIPDSDGMYIIQYCCNNNWLDIFQRIVDLHPIVLEQPMCSYVDLILYVQTLFRYRKSVFSFMLQNYITPTILDEIGNILVRLCCTNDLVDELQKLIERKPELLYEPNCSYSDLIFHAAEKYSKEIVLYLLNKSVDLTVPDANGMYMLQYCCKNNWFDVLQAVVTICPKSLEQQYCSYSHLLLYAAKYDRKKTVHYLMQKDVDVRICDSDGKYFIHYCIGNEWEHIVELLAMVDRELLELPDSEESTPVIYAAKCHAEPMVSLLLEKNVNIKKIDLEGKSLIHYCCENNLVDILEKMEVDKELLNQQDIFGSTPIVNAAKYDAKEAVEWLLEKNVDIKIPDNSGNSLIQYCFEKDWSDVAERLLLLLTT